MAEEATTTTNNEQGAPDAQPVAGAEAKPASASTDKETNSLLGGAGVDGNDKGADDKGKDEAKPDGKKDDAPGLPATPEAYAFEFDPDTNVDSELLSGFQQWAHENKVPLDAAKTLAKQYEGMIKQQAGARGEALAKLSESWVKELKADKDFGGEHWSTSLQHINAAMKEFGNDDIRGLFNATGLGNHPALVKFMASVGKALLEPGTMRGAAVPGKEKSAAEVLYPNN